MLKTLLKFQIFLSLLSLFACSDDKTSGVTVEDNALADVESSSSESFSSSSESSSSKVDDVVVVVNKGDLWNGSAGEYKVNTKNENTGYWFSWGDDASGGTSQILYPIPMGNEYSESSLDPVIDYCEGLCGNVVFGNTSNPEAGLGFSVANEGETVDISPWGGICVTYISDSDLHIYLESELGDKSDLSSMPQVRFAGLTRSDSSVTINILDSMSSITKCAKWSDFVVYKDNVLVRFGDEDAKKANAIIFKFYGTSGERRAFNIKSIGSFNDSLTGTN